MFIVLLVLILLFTFGPALVAVVSQLIAEGLGCQVDLHHVIPCVIGGHDYGQMFYDLGFLIWYSYLTLPIGGALLALWAVAAAVTFVISRKHRPAKEPSC
ncbi:hypothetical protein AUC71_01445 [Methyloceanibacter marginalis]|uniref:Uncharacterized protein n=1 Tax=Methyloceanibacter marginalis TaxID=1774971 RepID=A0A1E3W9Z7_9HYPH|nr:hypothetical protein AUC71_01445 [Methyloceanibacter marginalis]